MIGTRITQFVSEDYAIVYKMPGDVFSDEIDDYYRQGNTNIYRKRIAGGSYTNRFVKVVKESDPFFNFDISYELICNDNFPNISIGVYEYKGHIVPQFVGNDLLTQEW